MDERTPISNSGATDAARPPATTLVFPIAIGVVGAVLIAYFGDASIVALLCAGIVILLSIGAALWDRKRVAVHVAEQVRVERAIGEERDLRGVAVRATARGDEPRCRHRSPLARRTSSRG